MPILGGDGGGPQQLASLTWRLHNAAIRDTLIHAGLLARVLETSFSGKVPFVNQEASQFTLGFRSNRQGNIMMSA